MAVRALLAALPTTAAASTPIQITSADGWHTSYEVDHAIPGSHIAFESRTFAGSQFTCQMGGLREEEDTTSDLRRTVWFTHEIPDSEKVFYSPWYGASINDFTWVLLNKWNTTKGVHDIRVCRPRIIEWTYDFFPSCEPSVDMDKTDCPVECLVPDDQIYFCMVDLSKDHCVKDTRCIPEEGHYKPNKAGSTGLWQNYEGKCLAADHDKWSEETCSDDSKAQQWTFTAIAGGDVTV